MEINKPIKENSYAIYGLGLSGISVLRFLKKKKRLKKFLPGMIKKKQKI